MLDGMRISDKAIEAAAKVIHEDGWQGPPFWESLSDDHPAKLQAIATARSAFEAAAPFLMAQAWDEAWAKAIYWNKDLRDVGQPNPYRIEGGA
jgi:hypothetical protein